MRPPDRQKTGLALAIFLVFGFSLFVVSSIAIVAEARPFVAGAGNGEDRFEAIYLNKMKRGISQLSARMVLDSCSQAVTSIYGRFEPLDRREIVLANCLAQVEGTVQSMPTYGLAWFVGALLAAEQGDFANMNEKLLRAYWAAPYEQWIAELRVNLSELHLERLDDTYLDLHRRDLAMIVQNSRGISKIANRWVIDPDFRARITEIVEQLPEESQVKFVGRVRAAAAAFGR